MQRQFLKISCMVISLLLVASVFGACKKNDEKTSSASNNTQSAKASAKVSGTTAGKTTVTMKTAATAKTAGTASNNVNNSTNASGEVLNNNNTSGELQNAGASNDNNTSNPSEDTSQSIDLKGAKFIVADRAPAPLEDGDVIQAALYRSWQNAQQKYNFTLEWKLVSGGTGVITNEFIQSMMAGLKYCDVIKLATKQAYPGMIVNNMIAPIDDYIDFNSDPLFDTQYIKSAGLWNGKHYGYNTPVVASGFCVFYNRDIFGNANVQDPQDLVASGQWTWDAFLQSGQDTTKDLNGDGVIDQWGIECYFPTAAADALLFSNGCDYFSENSGQYTFALNEPRAVKALQFMSDLANVYGVMKHRPANTFANGGAAMYIGRYLGDGKNYLAANSFNYGLLPLPKGPDVQDYQYVEDGANNWSYPTNADVRSSALVMKDVLTIWDPAKADHVTYDDFTSAAIAANYNNQRDIELAKSAFTTPKVDMYRCFADMLTMVNNNVHNQIYNLQLTPAAGLAEITQPAQESIDLALEGKGGRP